MTSADRPANTLPTLRIVQSQYNSIRPEALSTISPSGTGPRKDASKNSLPNTYVVNAIAKPAEQGQGIKDHVRQDGQAFTTPPPPHKTTSENVPANPHHTLQQTSSNTDPNHVDFTATSKSQTPQYDSSTPENSVIEVGSASYQLPLDPSARPNAKLKNKYVLSDGSIVNGRGLGRGRPGIKRGSRKSTLSEEVITVDDNDSIIGSDAASKPKEQSSSSKRKRANSDILSDMNENLSDFSKESTPEYNPTSTQTRSGRQSNKPIPIIVPASATASPAAKRPALTQSVSSPSIKKHPKIKAKVYRGREQFALCEHCLRGNGPPGNAIVFCDACNKCWHQRCHDPKIPRQVVADTKAEWFCAECDRILHGKKKAKPQPPKPAAVLQPPTQSQSQPQSQIVASPSTNTTPSKLLTFGPPITAAGNLTLSQQKAYLNSLPKDKLIEIILKAAALAPLLPIMETPIPAKPAQNFILPPRPIPGQLPYPPPPAAPHQHPPQPPVAAPAQPIPQFTSNYTTPVDKMPVFAHTATSNASKSGSGGSSGALAVANEDEGYYDDFDEHGELYPKPGEGAYNLALPPESGDLGILLEGPECKTFSHWLKSSGVGYKRTIEGVK